MNRRTYACTKLIFHHAADISDLFKVKFLSLENTTHKEFKKCFLLMKPLITSRPLCMKATQFSEIKNNAFCHSYSIAHLILVFWGVGTTLSSVPTPNAIHHVVGKNNFLADDLNSDVLDVRRFEIVRELPNNCTL